MSCLTPLSTQQMLDIKELIEITKLRGKIKKRTRQRKRDPEKIPRPLNCFLLYRMEKQKQICELCPGANHRTISKIVAKWWKNISMSDKKKYMDAAKEAKTEHKSLYPDYRYVPRRKSSSSTQLEKSSIQDEEEVEVNKDQIEKKPSLTPISSCNQSYYQYGNECISNDPAFFLTSPSHQEEQEKNNIFFTPVTNSNFCDPTTNFYNINTEVHSLYPFYFSSPYFSSTLLNNCNYNNNSRNNMLQHDVPSSSTESNPFITSSYYSMINPDNGYINTLVHMIYGDTVNSYTDILNTPLLLTQPIYDSPLMTWSNFMLQPNVGDSLCYADPGYLMFPSL